ncbi:putative membrane-anchored protein, partial [Bradyrhizobium sp. F1.13.3]
AAILFTFALGTAAGDLATEALGLGFNVGVLAFAALIAADAGASALGVDAVLTFWVAYILTRPLGASLGDLLSQSREYGGLGLGTIYTSLAFLTVIIALVAWLSFEGERVSKTQTFPSN